MTDTTDTTTPEVTETPLATEEVKLEPTEVEQTEKTAESTENAKVETEDDQKPVENGASEATEGEESPPKLFVGRLPVGTKETQLKELFTPYGEVTHCDIVGKYGFVHMKSKEEANNAMTNLNNHSFNGSNITVQLSTSTAKKTKKKNQPRGKKFNDIKNNNNNGNRRPNVKNGFMQNKNKMNNNMNNRNNANNKNPNNQNRTNGNMNNSNNKMQRGNRNKFNRPMNRPMMPPQLSPMQNAGYYPNNQPPMNSYYQQPPMPAPQMQPAGPPRDMFYSRPPANNGQYYGSNTPAPPQMFSGVNVQPVQQPTQNYYQQPYNRGPVGPPMNNKMSPMPVQQAPPQQMAPYQYGPSMNTNGSPQMGYGQSYGGYGNGQMMNNGSNKYVGYFR